MVCGTHEALTAPSVVGILAPVTLTANLQRGCHYCSIPWMGERLSGFPKVPSKEAAVLGPKATVQPPALDSHPPLSLSLPAFSNQLVCPRGLRRPHLACAGSHPPVGPLRCVTDWLALQVRVLLPTWTPIPAQGLENHPRACFLCWSSLPEAEELYKVWLPLKSQHRKGSSGLPQASPRIYRNS